MLLPSYNALKDPYLIGYFDNPGLKKHLKETGVIRKKRRKSVSSQQAKTKTEEMTPSADRVLKRRKESKSRAKSVHHKETKLPGI